MVQINYCPSCGGKLNDGTFICPFCNLDVEELFGKGYLLMSDVENNSIELFEGLDNEKISVLENKPFGDDIMDNENIDIKPGDEIVIVVPQDADEDDLVIDLDKLGIDVENLGDNVNIVVQVEGMEDIDEDMEFFDDDIVRPNEWYFDDDPYDIVYYEFVNDEDFYD